MTGSSLEPVTDIIPEEDKKDQEKIKQLTTKIFNSEIEMLEKML